MAKPIVISNPEIVIPHVQKVFSLLDQIECYPKSERCFSELFEKTLSLLRYAGNRELGFSEFRIGVLEYIKENAQGKKIEENSIYMVYNRPLKLFSKPWDELILLRCENEIETEYQFKRIAGHLTNQREARLDGIERVLRGISFMDIISGLGELQPAYFSLTREGKKNVLVEYH